jgi:uncharacterized membrane protein YhaH (DUF805 family)
MPITRWYLLQKPLDGHMRLTGNHPVRGATMSWIRLFLGFRGRLDREQYKQASQILSFACWLPAVPFYWSNVAVPIAAVFLPAIWPWLVLNIKRLRDSGRSARFVVQLMSARLFAGGSLLAGSLKLIGPLTTFTTFAAAIAGFCVLQEKIGKLPSRQREGEHGGDHGSCLAPMAAGGQTRV